MRNISYKRPHSTRAPVTSIVDQSLSALQQSGVQNARIGRLDQSGGWASPSTVQGQSQIHRRFNGATSQTLLLKDVQPRRFQIEFSPISENPEGTTTPKTPVLFTVNGTKSRLSSAMSRPKAQRIKAPQHNTNNAVFDINNANGLSNDIAKPLVSSEWSSLPSSSNLNSYPLHQKLGNVNAYYPPNLASTPQAPNVEHRSLNHDRRQLLSNPISPIYYRMEDSKESRDEFKDTASLNTKLISDEQRTLPQHFRVQASNKAMEFVAIQEKTLQEPVINRSSHKVKRSMSASRPQYSKPSHPAFLKEVDIALHKLQSNAIYSSTIDMLSNNDINQVYTAQPAHFKLMRKKWKASEPPSLPPPPSSDDTLPDGIPVLTANPHELKGQYMATRKPAKPIPASSTGFFIESDPQASKKTYNLRRVNSAGASSTTVKQSSIGLTDAQAPQQCSLRLARDSGNEVLSMSEKGHLPENPPIFQYTALLTPDVSMQTDTVKDTITTPVTDLKSDRLTIDEFQQPLLMQKQIHGLAPIRTHNAHATGCSTIPPRSRSVGEYSASQETYNDLTDTPLLNVRSLVDTRHHLRSPLPSRNLSSRRSSSAQRSRSSDVVSASRVQAAAHSGSTVSTQKRPIRYQSIPLFTGRNIASASHALPNQTANNSVQKRRPLSSREPSRSGAVYKTIYGEKPIARGFSARSSRLTHNSMQSTASSATLSLQPDVRLTPKQPLSTSRALAVSAVVPTSSLALSMASSYIQSQARSRYNAALMRLQAPAVTLEATPSQRTKTRAVSSSVRHSRRTVGIQPHSVTDQSVNTNPPIAAIKSSLPDESSVVTKGANYFTRTRNAKIGTIELKDACTETGSYKSTTEVSDARSSVDYPLSFEKHRSVQVLDDARIRRSHSSSSREVTKKTNAARIRPRSSSSIKVTDKPSAIKTSSFRRSQSATFHSHNKTTLAPTYSISTTDMLAARRLIQPHANPRFTDHKRDVITRHLADIAAIPLHPRESRLSAEKSNQSTSPNLAEMLQGLDIPTINSAESSAFYDPHTLTDEQLTSNSVYDPSISRNQSAESAFNSMHTLPSTELSGKTAHTFPQSTEFIQLLGANAFPSSSATLEMYIGGLNYQEIDLQHHIFSKHGTTTPSEPSKKETEVPKKKSAPKTRSGSVSASFSAIPNVKRCRSSSPSCSGSRRGQAVSNSVEQTISHDVEPQVSLDLHASAHIPLSVNIDMVLEDLDTDGIDTSCMKNSAVRTSNYKETVLLRHKTPDGRTRLAMVSTGDILYDNDCTRTALALSAQYSQRPLSASAHSALHRQHNKVRSTRKTPTMLNYPSITGAFPLYANDSEQEPEVSTVPQTDTETVPPQGKSRRVSRSLPPSRQQHRLKDSSSLVVQRTYISSDHKTLSVSASAAMARRAFEKQANDKTLNTLMHQTAVSDISGLHGSPATSFPRDLSYISQRQSVDKEPAVTKEQDKDTIYHSPVIFTSLVQASPPLPTNPDNTVDGITCSDNQNALRNSQPLLRSHTTLDHPRKESARKARSNRLTEGEKDMRASALSDTQHNSKSERSYRGVDGKADSRVRYYGRSQVRPVSSSSLSGSMTAGRANRCRSSFATRSVSSAGRENRSQVTHGLAN